TMPSLSLGTLKSSPDEKGNCHRLSIDALSSKSHEFVTTYKARIFSFNSDRDPRDRELVHVRFPATQGVCTDAWAECELEKSELARKLATKFNEYVRQMTRIKPDISDLEATRISFLKSQMATLDSISFVHRKRKKGDCLVFQEVLEDVFHFIGSTGDADSANHDLANPLLQTFVHFSFCHTRGQAVICGLKGTISNDQYKLVTPVIHSMGRHFGEKDGGKRAMRKVLDNHRCSALCRHLPTHFN
ncbi:hypothetical protein EGW08_008064, partial [Elysia chlorotica]